MAYLTLNHEMLHNVNQLASSHALATLGVKLPFPNISSPAQTVTAADYFGGMKGKSRALQQHEQQQQLEQEQEQQQQQQQEQQQHQGNAAAPAFLPSLTACMPSMTADQKAKAASRKCAAFEKQLRTATGAQDTIKIRRLQHKIDEAKAECLQAERQAAEERHATGRAPTRKASEGVQKAVASTMSPRKRKEVSGHICMCGDFVTAQ